MIMIFMMGVVNDYNIHEGCGMIYMMGVVNDHDIHDGVVDHPNIHDRCGQ